MKRKGKYAAYGKVIMPHRLQRGGPWLRHCSSHVYEIEGITSWPREKMLAVAIYMGVNIFTYEITKNQIQRESSDPAPQRYAQSQRGESPGSAFSGGRVFRPARRGAGQIRDAASRPEGRHGHFSRRLQFRNVPPVILQGPERFCARGDEWVNSEATWSKKTSQADAGDLAFRDSDSSPGAGSENLGTDRSASREVWHSHPPQVAGTSFARCEKKTAPSLALEGGSGCPNLSPVLVERYENLRRHVLSRCIFPEMRPGYGVLVARGVAAWMEVVEDVVRPLQPLFSSAEASPATVPPQVHDDLVRVMGEVVMALTTKRAPL